MMLSACASVPDQAAFESSGLDGEWRIVSLNGTAIDGSMQLQGHRMSVTFGCNLATGTFRIVAGRLVAGPLAASEMACPRSSPALPDTMKLESEGFGMLSEPLWIAGTIDSRRLRLWNDRGWMLTEFLPERP